MRSVRVTACAKVNLCLEVLGRRSDGYHEVRSLMQSISLADDLVFEEAAEPSLVCDLPGLEEGNLVIKAARTLRAHLGETRGARMVLRKGIPVASGLGGSSADAAASLVALARLWGAEIGWGELGSMASDLGSDVPFFLSGGTALVRGRGEEVVVLPDAHPLWLVLLVPPHQLAAKTAEMYRHLTPADWSSGERAEAMARGASDKGLLRPELMDNAFERVANEVFPSLASYRAAMVDAGAASVHLSGAGSAIFSLFESEASANSVANSLRETDFAPLVARTLTSVEARPTPHSFAPSDALESTR